MSLLIKLRRHENNFNDNLKFETYGSSYFKFLQILAKKFDEEKNLSPIKIFWHLLKCIDILVCRLLSGTYRLALFASLALLTAA